MNDIRKSLNITIESPYWDMAYEKAISEPLPEWLTESYIREIHGEYGFFSKNLETIVSAIPHITEVPELCLLAKVLYHILDTKKNFNEAFTHFEAPKAPQGTTNTIGYDCVLGFPVLAHLVPSWKALEKRGIERDVIADSLVTVDHLFTYSEEEVGRKAFTEQFFRMYGNAIYINYLKIGRLRFEIFENSNRPARIFENNNGEHKVIMCNCVLHKSGHILGAYGFESKEGSYEAEFTETDKEYIGYAVNEKTGLCEKVPSRLDKKEWTPVYVPGDNGLKVHIPYGDRLTKEACEDSYRRAKEIFERCYPEIHFDGFHLFCWMLSPELCDILPESSNIIEFQSKYTVFPAKDNAVDAIMYVCGIKEENVHSVNPKDLPEGNTLQRGIKKKALEGTLIHQHYGFFKW